MSKQYPGGLITKTPVTPSGPYENSTASGIWTLEQQAYWQKLGQWPIPGNTQIFIEDVFSTYLYTGTNPPTATQTVVNGIDLAGKGGLVWIKPRNAAEAHILSNTATGVNNFLQSQSNSENSVGTNWLTAFNSDGFTVGNNINAAIWNLVSWTWRKQAKFFDIVTYTGNGTAGRTIAHNLGSVPGCIIVKQLGGGSTGGVNNWFVYHRSLGGTKYLGLDGTFAAVTSSSPWNNTDPTSTVFTIGGTSDCNDTGGTYVAYLWAHDAGGFGLTGTDNVISCGSFTTDSSGNATVNLGYEPQYILMKKTSGVQNWVTYDNMRGWAQAQQAQLYPNITQAEDVYTGSPYFFPTATGFSLSGTFGLGNNDTFIYITIRRGPMAVPTVGTSVFSPITNSATTGTVNTTGFPVDMGIVRWRDGTDSNFLRSRLQGVSSTTTESGAFLKTNATDAESTSGGLTRLWNNTGFQTTSGFSTYSTVYWNFGRAPGFFDEVCYDGTGATATTQTHNLGVVPEFMIFKSRNTASTSWVCYHKGVNGGVNPQNYYMLLQSDQAQVALTSMFNDTAPTSSVFTVGPQGSIGASGRTYVAYLFATCAGVSKVGSYTGTATTLQIDCGFTGGSRFVMIKRTDSTGDWYVWDSARGIVAGNDPYLLLNSTAAEVTGTDYVDTYSAGFEISSTAPAAINANGGTFIFLAIA